MTALPLCECGCGAFVKLTRDGKPNRFLRGHTWRNRPRSTEQRLKLSLAMQGKPGPWLGKKMSPESRLKMSAAKKGRSLPPQHRAKIAATMKGKPHPSIHHKQSLETRLKKSLAQRGERGSNWRGGLSAINECARASFQFRDWRLQVFRRDKFMCQDCGAKHPLHAHHLKPFAQFPALRFEVSNGLTVCKHCHDIRHGRIKTK